VLNSVRFGEGHKIVRIFTEDLGKIEASAFGARKIKSRFGSKLEPFTIAVFLLYRGSGENPYSVKEVEVETYNSSIRDDLNKYLIGNALIEPVVRFVENAQADHELFNLIINVFRALEKVSSKRSIFLLSMYEIRFLDIMGYKPDTHTCIKCGRQIDKPPLYYNYLHGFPLCRDCGGSSSHEVFQGTERFINWSLKSPFENAERVSMNKSTVHNLRHVIEVMFLSNFGRKLNSWDQLKTMFEFID
jgi:DNA repair protein RecO (recombination protein O)